MYLCGNVEAFEIIINAIKAKWLQSMCSAYNLWKRVVLVAVLLFLFFQQNWPTLYINIFGIVPLLYHHVNNTLTSCIYHIKQMPPNILQTKCVLFSIVWTIKMNNLTWVSFCVASGQLIRFFPVYPEYQRGPQNFSSSNNNSLSYVCACEYGCRESWLLRFSFFSSQSWKYY